LTKATATQELSRINIFDCRIRWASVQHQIALNARNDLLNLRCTTIARKYIAERFRVKSFLLTLHRSS